MKDIILKLFDQENLFAVGLTIAAVVLITKASSCMSAEQRDKHEAVMGQQHIEQLKLEALKGCGKLWA